MEKKNKKILIGCYEVPLDGGASTSAYQIFEEMQKDGFDVTYINIISEEDVDYYRYVMGEGFGNPRNLYHVHNCVVNKHLFYPNFVHEEIVQVINRVSPDIMICVDFIATLLMKRAAPQIRSIFLTAGCEQVKSYVFGRKARDLIHLQNQMSNTMRDPAIYHIREKEAVEIADIILTHSEVTKFFYEKFYPFQIGKIYQDIFWQAEWSYQESLPYVSLKKRFSERDIDLLFIASDWKRQEKNYPLVKRIISKCKNLEIHIVGEFEKKIVNATFHSTLNKREDIFRLLGRSKSIVCPSLFDAAPNILYEASAMDCNIVASRNCGNWQICNNKLLVDTFNLRTFLEKIRLSISKKYEDNIDYFLNSSSYKNLTDIISVF